MITRRFCGIWMHTIMLFNPFCLNVDSRWQVKMYQFFKNIQIFIAIIGFSMKSICSTTKSFSFNFVYLCWFQTNLPLAALMMILVQLRKRHLPQRDDQAASSGKQRQANRSITLPLCPPRQIADSWILFNLGAIAAWWKAKATLPLRAATLKQQAMITRRSGKAASGKLVWNQHYITRVIKRSMNLLP